MIPPQFIEDVQQKTDIVRLVSEYIPLKRAGRNFRALCPFHGEKTPSFMVSPQKQIFHCFGCGEGGGVFQFLMLHDKVTFVEAVEILAKRLGMVVPKSSATGKDKLKTSLYELTAAACTYFHELLSSAQGARARHMLRQRGISDSTIARFRIGYAPGGTSLMSFMRKKGFTLDLLEKASLVTSRQDSGYRDLFRDRIIFPIYDIRSRVVGFGARTLSNREGVPKYINSPENILYSKRAHLYGLSNAKEAVLKEDCVFITEGYLDMITPYQEGICNIVAGLGTALTVEQIRLIRRYTRNIVLIYDADKAGQTAASRAIELLIENDCRVHVVCLPDGYDLDLAVREKGVAFINDLFLHKKDFFEYKLSMLKGAYDIQSIEGKSTIARELLKVIDVLPSEVAKHEYIKSLASALSVKEEVLLAELESVRGITRYPEVASSDLEEKIPLVERFLLKFIFTHTRALAAVRKKVHADDFSHPLAKEAFSLAEKYMAAETDFSLPVFINAISDRKVNGFISRLLLEDMGELNKEAIRDCMARMRNNRIRATKEQLKAQIREAEEAHNTKELRMLMERFKRINSEVRNG